MADDPRFPPIRRIPGLTPWDGPGLANTPRTGQSFGAPPDNLSRPGGSVSASSSLEIYELHRYAKLNGTLTFATSVASALVVAAPTTFRNMLLLRNTDATDTIYVNFGNDASLTSILALEPGIQILFDTVVPQDDIFAIASANTPVLAVAFSTIALPV